MKIWEKVCINASHSRAKTAIKIYSIYSLFTGTVSAVLRFLSSIKVCSRAPKRPPLPCTHWNHWNVECYVHILRTLPTEWLETNHLIIDWSNPHPFSVWWKWGKYIQRSTGSLNSKQKRKQCPAQRQCIVNPNEWR